ncbi:MAG: polysaccharide pyruvyl transferase family protein, partial [Aristaeellaceae bacterium]
EELATYRGEKVLLPLDGFFRYSREYPSFPTSDDIIPVFLGIYAPSRAYLKHHDFWQTYGPIGCRDEATLLAMRREGFDAYLTGCMTVLFPRRDQTRKRHRVFLVDAYAPVEQYMPKDLLDSAEHVTHDIPVRPNASRAEVIQECEEKAHALYDMYRDEAALVITSRLHCAVPCIAMGIPTIVVKDSFDDRFGWLDRWIHLYSRDEFDRIDWNPAPIDMEDFKVTVRQMAESMIRRAPDRALLTRIHETYMQRDRKKISSPLMVRGYMWLAQYCPRLASFLREKVLFRFTIAAKAKNSQGAEGSER